MLSLSRSKRWTDTYYRLLLTKRKYGGPSVNYYRPACSSSSFSRDSSIDQFADFLPADCFITNQDIVKGFYTDWLGETIVQPNERSFVLQPKETSQVSQILRHCNQNGIRIVPQGGNTGLVAGGVPCLGDEIVLSMRRMNKVLDIDTLDAVATVESGCILDELSSSTHDKGFGLPIDLASSGSCTIGGNLATNAGGTRVVRHGSLRSNVLGLEVVLADGTVLNMLSGLRKNNSGYDLKQLFIGSEGTLGIITKASIALPPIPKSVNAILLWFPDYQSLISAVVDIRRDVGEIVSAVEFWDSKCMNLVLSRFKNIADPRPELKYDGGSESAFLLLETSGSDPEHDEEKLLNFVDSKKYNGILARSSQHVKDLWALRELITLALKEDGGHTYKYDISLPLSTIDNMIRNLENKVKDVSDEARIYQYGHIADGGLHTNIWVPKPNNAVQSLASQTLYKFCNDNAGSVSAEHGIGLKKERMSLTEEAQIDTMKALKTTLDPNNILNPGKVL